MVLGADGLHSRTRALLFGPEEQFYRYLGYCFAVFTMRNTFGLTRETAGREVPGMLAALREADGLFFDGAGQIRMPRWSSGRAALVGDTASAPSFLTGQGTSLALVGACPLAGSPAGRDRTAGFAAYEHCSRAFVALNQAQAGHGGATLVPTTARALEQRNTMLRGLATRPATEGRPAHSALTRPDFAQRPEHDYC
ncbi:oxidoreductase [Streptomyces paromomycinus]|uniref:Oxidoreductase n=1 Tax=Streptomyces paromomycinus TaxID=92743 RepID=A0A401W0U6_STREY|nr:oxidoreductase [Streptomyces paromomycinus]